MGIFDFLNGGKKKRQESEKQYKEIIQKERERLDKELTKNKEIQKKNSDTDEQLEELIRFKNNFLNSIEKDEEGNIKLLDSSVFFKIFKKNQNKILDFDKKHNKSFTHDFVKISNYLKTKKSNIENIFNSIKNVEPNIKKSISREYYLSLTNKFEKANILLEQNTNMSFKAAADLIQTGKDVNRLKFDILRVDEMIKIFENQIYSYQLLLFHSLNMIDSLINEDMITFWEIYEALDKLTIFNSNWENEVLQKLNDIELELNEILNSIQNMEVTIISAISNLNYTIENSFQSLTKELKNIDSSISLNNLLTTIQTYQVYKINKNTKSLRS